MWFGTHAGAADLPMHAHKRVAKVSHGAQTVPAKAPARVSAKSKPAKQPLQVASAAPEQAEAPAQAEPPQQAEAASEEPVAPLVAPKSKELQMSWVLGPLTATADGPKSEGSSSVEGNLVVIEPGYVTSPYMVIELDGHIVKTADTVVRIDVQVGDVRKSISWKADEVSSGRFKEELLAPIPEGALPGYYPVSAIAFVTRTSKQGVAMISLEKISVRVGKLRQMAEQ